MPIGFCDWVKQALAIAWKDIRSEWRTRHALAVVVMFALTSLVVVSFTLGPGGLYDVRTHEARAVLASALLWLILFFAALSGMSRCFVKEEDTKTAVALRLTANPNAVYVGKLLFNLWLLVVVEVIVVPTFVVLMNVTVPHRILLLASIVMGTAGVGAAGTMLAAMVAKARSGVAFFGVIAFPILMPVLTMAVRTTADAFGASEGASAELHGMTAYAVVVATASLMLFEHVWRR